MNASITGKHSSRMCTAHLLTRRGVLHGTPFTAPLSWHPLSWNPLLWHPLHRIPLLWSPLHSILLSWYPPFMALPFMEPPFMALPFTVPSFHRTPLHGTQFYRSPFHGTPFISPTPCGQHHPTPPREQNESQVQKHYLAPNFVCGR